LPPSCYNKKKINNSPSSHPPSTIPSIDVEDGIRFYVVMFSSKLSERLVKSKNF